MSIPLTINQEIQKMLKDRGLILGEIDGVIDLEEINAIENLFFEMGINYAGWNDARKLIGAEELFYESQGIDVGKVDGLDDHYIQHAREVYKSKLATTWRDKVEEIHTANAPPDTSGSEWAAKYTLTQKALNITAKQYDAYREAVGFIESRNNPDQGAGGAGGHYWGMYQFGTAATQTTSAFLKDNTSKEDFQGNQDLAEKHFDALSYLNHKALSKSEEYNKLSAIKKLAVLGYAHNQGAGGARNWLESGEEGHDAFGTSGKKYYDAILKAIENIKDEPQQVEKIAPPHISENVDPPQEKKIVTSSREVNNDGFGVGFMYGKKVVSDTENRKRPSYMSGTIMFEGFSDPSLNKVTFDAGSGGRDSYPSIPLGTYSLSPQGVGNIISNYYSNNGLDPSEGAFRKVFNVGTPDNITSTGYDPKVDRNRSQIQIHSNVRKDKSRLVSSGCLTVTPDDFPDLVAAIEKAMEETGNKVALVVENAGDYEANFKIMPAVIATNPVGEAVEEISQPVSKEVEEVKEVEETISQPVEIDDSNLVFVGDSVALGLLYAHSEDGVSPDERFVEIGVGPKKILEKIGSIPSSEFSGKTVILSPGLLNNVTDISNVYLIIQALKAKGGKVVLVGGPNEETARQDLKDVNSNLEQIAAKERIPFLGPYESKDGVHPKKYGAYKLTSAVAPVSVPKKVIPEASPKVTEPTKDRKVLSLRDIDINQLKFIRGIGKTESGFSRAEAYSEAYNQEDNNRNVREYGQKGADYGYYQCNELDVEHAIRVGVHPEIAKHLNGGGKNGKSSVAQQTIAMHEYISRVYKDEYEALKSGKDSAFEAAIDRMNGKWFGLRDRPEVARDIWKSDVSIEDLFPEVNFVPVNKPEPPKPVIKIEEKKKPTIIVPPKRTFNWPKQNACEEFYGEVGTNQVRCNLPFTMVLAWDKGTKVNSYLCHKLVKDPMERIWNRVYEHYGYDKIVELRLNLFGGCLNVRKMRGGSSWSMHAWGIAVDIDPERNSLYTTWKNSQMSKPEYEKFVQFWYDEGAINLGKERDFDPMHFQFANL